MHGHSNESFSFGFVYLLKCEMKLFFFSWLDIGRFWKRPVAFLTIKTVLT